MKLSEESYKIVFLGAPRAGKSTLMAAWYHLAKTVYRAEPDATFAETRDFVEMYENWRSGEQVSKTELGDKVNARFDCMKGNRKFHLELSDYSGEDMLNFVNDQATNLDRETNSDIETSLKSAIEGADWLIHVCDPERLAKGSAQDQNNALYFAKLLPKVLGERPTLAQTTSSYFSRADELSLEITDKAEKMMEESADLEYLGRSCQASSVISRPTDETDQEMSVELQSFFNQTMTDLLAGVAAKPKKSIKSTLPLVIAAILIIGFLYWWPTSSGIDPWAAQQKQFNDLKSEAVDASWEQGQQLLAELDAWKNKNTVEHPEQLSDLQQDFDELVNSLSSIPKLKGKDEITQAVINVLQQTGGNLPKFYEELGSDAAEYKTGTVWDNDAKKLWSEVANFCTKLNGKTEISLISSWVEGPQWWTSVWGFSDLKAEIWRAPIGASCPFDKDTNGDNNPLRIFETDWNKPVASGGGTNHQVMWTKWNQSNISIDLTDQLWLRVMECEGKNETWIQQKIIRKGPLGLAWFDGGSKRKTAIDNESQFYITIRAAPQPLTVPDPIIKAFTSLGW